MDPNERAPGHDPRNTPDDTLPPPATGPRADEPPAERRLPLRELTRGAGVSVRTVRYYIAEGLLPPPVGGGPQSAYTQGHLDRLRLIGRLKDRYLPLKEIRRRLAGLDDAEVRRLLIEESTAPPSRPIDSAGRYLDRPLEPPRPTMPRPTPPAPPTGFHVSAMAADTGHPSIPSTESSPSHPVLGRAYPAPYLPDVEPEDDLSASAPEPVAWRRVPLGDDAELLIRESAYHRRRDRIDWLVAWARKVFG